MNYIKKIYNSCFNTDEDVIYDYISYLYMNRYLSNYNFNHCIKCNKDIDIKKIFNYCEICNKIYNYKLFIDYYDTFTHTTTCVKGISCNDCSDCNCIIQFKQLKSEQCTTHTEEIAKVYYALKKLSNLYRLNKRWKTLWKIADYYTKKKYHPNNINEKYIINNF